MRTDLLELTTPEDAYYNYCWWPYQPLAPTHGKLRPVSLLLHSFAVAGLDRRAFDLVRMIQQAIGRFRTVYGIKLIDGRLAWELYFYDYQRRQRQVSITRVLQAIGPLVACEVPVDERLPYFMFSLDLTAEILDAGRLDTVHMYIGNPGSAVSSGIAYALAAGATTLENFYFFFNAERDLQEAAGKVLCSAYIDGTATHVDEVLWPELRSCHTICIANKRQNDTAYFSGLDVDQLLWFLRRLDYPAPIIRFVQDHHDRLDHLQYDAGFDFDGRAGSPRVIKSGFYGVF
jgi:hypothetical protein